MVKIRLKRMGAKKKPFYRIVVADSRTPRDGRFIEEIGTYDPLKDPAEVNIDEAKANKWLENGAKPTDIVKSLFEKQGIGGKVYVVPVEEALAEEAPAEEAPVEAPAEEAAEQAPEEEAPAEEAEEAKADEE